MIGYAKKIINFLMSIAYIHKTDINNEKHKSQLTIFWYYTFLYYNLNQSTSLTVAHTIIKQMANYIVNRDNVNRKPGNSYLLFSVPIIFTAITSMLQISDKTKPYINNLFTYIYLVFFTFTFIPVVGLYSLTPFNDTYNLSEEIFGINDVRKISIKDTVGVIRGFYPHGLTIILSGKTITDLNKSLEHIVDHSETYQVLLSLTILTWIIFQKLIDNDVQKEYDLLRSDAQRYLFIKYILNNYKTGRSELSETILPDFINSLQNPNVDDIQKEVSELLKSNNNIELRKKLHFPKEDDISFAEDFKNHKENKTVIFKIKDYLFFPPYDISLLFKPDKLRGYILIFMSINLVYRIHIKIMRKMLK